MQGVAEPASKAERLHGPIASHAVQPGAYGRDLGWSGPSESINLTSSARTSVSACACRSNHGWEASVMPAGMQQLRASFWPSSIIHTKRLRVVSPLVIFVVIERPGTPDIDLVLFMATERGQLTHSLSVGFQGQSGYD